MAQVLLVAKSTNLELHGDGFVSAEHEESLSILNNLKIAHKEHHDTLSHLKKVLVNLGIKYSEVTRGHSWPKNWDQYDAVITVGGDGTVLQASHRILDDSTTLIGIRSSGLSVGHLCTGDNSQILEVIELLCQKKLQEELLPRFYAHVVKAQSSHQTKTPPILNDVLFCNKSAAATTRYILTRNGQTEIQKSSGIWLSASSGSTAGIRAAGGDIQERTDQRVQFMVREPYVPPQQKKGYEFLHGYFTVAPEKESDFVITNQCVASLLAFDGTVFNDQISYADQIVFTKAPSLRMAKALSSLY